MTVRRGLENMKNKRVLVTGAEGYLGARISNFLQSQGFSIVCLARDRYYSLDNSDSFSTVDWSSFSDLETACRGVSIIIHAAGLNAQECMVSPTRALDVNGLNTCRLVSAAKSCEVELMIHLSTVHVYSEAPNRTYDESSGVDNLHPYAVSHIVGEHAVGLFNDNNHRGLSLRVSNIVGSPNSQLSKGWDLFVNDLARQAIRNTSIMLRSNRKSARDFITISDFLSNLKIVICNYGSLKSNVINACSSKTLTIEELSLLFAATYKNRFGKQIKINWGNSETSLSSVPHFCYDNSLLRSLGADFKNNFEYEIDEILKVAGHFFGK
ncbi:NAD-dependent epimerase/dehydratase family protein [Alphaproteobacteria bacterium]|nr:NAD-dependent epimerase/dehydratase family protein [Alphaproteobacteria bacterium]